MVYSYRLLYTMECGWYNNNINVDSYQYNSMSYLHQITRITMQTAAIASTTADAATPATSTRTLELVSLDGSSVQYNE